MNNDEYERLIGVSWGYIFIGIILLSISIWLYSGFVVAFGTLGICIIVVGIMSRLVLELRK